MSERQRIDKWLWHARVVRTRVAAVVLAQAGYVRINGRRVKAASRPIEVGDIITVSLANRVRVMKVVKLAERRGSGSVAQTLYEDLA